MARINSKAKPTKGNLRNRLGGADDYLNGALELARLRSDLDDPMVVAELISAVNAVRRAATMLERGR